MWVAQHKASKTEWIGGHLCEGGVVVKMGDWLYTRVLDKYVYLG